MTAITLRTPYVRAMTDASAQRFLQDFVVAWIREQNDPAARIRHNPALTLVQAGLADAGNRAGQFTLTMASITGTGPTLDAALSDWLLRYSFEVAR